MGKKELGKTEKGNDANAKNLQNSASKSVAENKTKKPGDEEAADTILSSVFHEFMNLQICKWVGRIQYKHLEFRQNFLS